MYVERNTARAQSKMDLDLKSAKYFPIANIYCDDIYIFFFYYLLKHIIFGFFSSVI